MIMSVHIMHNLFLPCSVRLRSQVGRFPDKVGYFFFLVCAFARGSGVHRRHLCCLGFPRLFVEHLKQRGRSHIAQADALFANRMPCITSTLASQSAHVLKIFSEATNVLIPKL